MELLEDFMQKGLRFLRPGWITMVVFLALVVFMPVWYVYSEPERTNYLLGEEFLFRGILLPKMKGVFGKYYWFFNGVLFGLYHIHKPGIMFWSAIFTGFLFSYLPKRFQSSWMSVIVHGAEALFILFLILGIVLGLA